MSMIGSPRVILPKPINCNDYECQSDIVVGGDYFRDLEHDSYDIESDIDDFFKTHDILYNPEIFEYVLNIPA